ncbi:MAG: DUF3108 domain-containing protein [Bryobacterales bacterium]|nr:DUF3108 domain-containing protein [Bryobacterales bacterium]
MLLFLLLPASGETLHYAISWPSGLSLGEATLDATKSDSGEWHFGFDLDASVPGFAIRDKYQSKALGPGICSSELVKTMQRGSRKSEETDSFDQKAHLLTRQTKAPGGKSDYSISGCARDALAFLQFARNELAAGRLAQQQQIVLGGAYDVRLELSGTETVKSNGKPVQADRVQTTIKGPASEITVQILFARDAARTPVLARIPLSLGTFTVELTH